ncbi:MAG TPA: GAF domain-containing protein [Chthoniobacterales bacterium]
MQNDSSTPLKAAGNDGVRPGAGDESQRRLQERTAELEQTNAALRAEIAEHKRTEDALRRSEHHARELVNALPAAVYACDTQGCITFYNQAAEALWGRKPECGKDLWCGSWKVYNPDGSPLPLDQCPMAVALREGRPVRGREIIVERPDGTRTDVLTYPDPIRNASGVMIGTVNMLVDLTERRRVDAELQLANSRIGEIFENITDAFVALDAKWRYTYVNERAAQLLGKPKSQLLGRCVWEVFPEMTGTAADQKIRRAFAEQVPEEFEAFNPVFGNWYENHVYPTREGVSIYWRDITERKRVEEARHARSRRLSAIIGTQQEIANAALDLNAVTRSIVERAQSLTGAKGATLELVDGNYLVYHVTSGAAAPHTGLRINMAFSLSGLCVRSGEILLCADAETDSRVDGKACRQVGLRSMIVVPLRHGDANLGVLKVFSSEPHAFAEEDVNTLRLLAGFLASAMHLAAEFEAKQDSETKLRLALDAREIYARQQATIAAFGRRALNRENLSLLFEDVVGAVAETLDLDVCNALEFVPGNHSFSLRAGLGFRPDPEANLTLPVAAGSPAGDALRRSQVIVFNDLPYEPRFMASPGPLKPGCVSGAAVPIPGRAGPFGVLEACSTRPRSFTADDMNFLQAVTAIVGTAIERHELEKELLEISGREQRRIGHDLHDDLCQRLGGLQLLSGVLAEELAGEGRAEAGPAGRILAQAREALERARLLARGLAPIALEADGLVTALEELAENSAELYGISCEFRAPAPVALEDPGAATHLYRIAQEAISNAVKHGRAKQVTISLTGNKDTFQLEISDNGQGFVPETAAPAGMGLRIMKYRAAMIGATEEVRSAPGQGTTVTCTFGKHLGRSTH